MTNKTSFQLVADMNTAFGNMKGAVHEVDAQRLLKQCANIFDEYVELLQSFGFKEGLFTELRKAHRAALNHMDCGGLNLNLEDFRDALCDIQVFDKGAQHLAGVDGDRDMQDVIEGVMSRFIKDEADKAATIALHAAKGVTKVYFEGEYPKMVMKSAEDQPDAPKGKFLKSASYKPTVFRDPPNQEWVLKFSDGYYVDLAGCSCVLADAARYGSYKEALANAVLWGDGEPIQVV